MKAGRLLDRVLALPGVERRLAPRLDALHGVAPGLARLIAYGLGGAAFLRGAYRDAHEYYSRVDEGKFGPEARRMADWTAHKLGNLAIGWPRYPVATFEPPPIKNAALTGGPVLVRDHAKPIELVTALALPEWSRDMPAPGDVLIWFNFRSSLGGELFTARAVRAMLDETSASAVLAADPRLVEMLTANFPDCRVISRNSDIAPLIEQVSSYFLARDALSFVLKDDGHVGRVAGVRFDVPRVRESSGREGKRPRIAVSWKTTNKRQGLYRNISASDFAAALKGIDADFLSVQHGVESDERSSLEAALGRRIDFDAIDPSADLVDLSAGIRSTDAVITIDNSVLHIAGSIGHPAIGLLSVPSYWAWPASGTTCHWYPSIHLIHQDTPGNWRTVLDAVPSAVAQILPSVRN